jgi:MFS family permease
VKEPDVPSIPISSSLVPEDPAEAALHWSVRRKIVWRIVPLLACANCLASLERANLGIAGLSMNTSLGLTEATFGLAAGLFFIGYFVFEGPSNMALARFGARTWLARIAVTWGLVATATALVQNAESLYVTRILLGIAEAGLFPGVVFFFTPWLPPRDRAQMLAWFAVGAALSGILGPPLSGAILTLWPQDLFGLEGWRALFVIEGVPSIIVGVLIWILLVDNPDRARWLSPAEKAWLALQLKKPSGTSAHRNPLHALLDPRILVLSIAYFAKNCGLYVLVFFMPQIIKTLTTQNGSQLSTMSISLLSAVPAVFGTIAAILWPLTPIGVRNGGGIPHSR